MSGTTVGQSPTVFISYAHDGAGSVAAVAELAAELGKCGCSVLTDHAYRYRAPPRGWQVWMQDCIRDADFVLVVCTPKLKERFEKNAPPGEGFGVTFEGAIVTQHLYDARMLNTKFYPIAPDGGALADVPTALRPWWNGHRFPSGLENIRRMILDDPGSDTAPGASTAGTRVDMDHAELAKRLLAAPGARSLLESLSANLHRDRTVDPADVRPDPASLVEWLLRPAPGQPEILQRFAVILAALKDLKDRPEGSSHTRRETGEAAAAMYCLAACALVDRAAVVADRHLVFRVPRSTNIIYAIISTAVVGGELRLATGSGPDRVRANHVFDVAFEAGTEDFGAELESFAYCRLFPNEEETEAVRGAAGRLTGDQRARLAARLWASREADGRRFVIVLPEAMEAAPFGDFAAAHEVPVMLPDDALAEGLLRMDPGILKAHIEEFWHRLQIYRQPADAEAGQRDREKETPDGASGMNARDKAGERSVTIQTGSHSSVTVTTGDRSSAHSEMQVGEATAALAALMLELRETLQALPDTARTALAPKIAEVESEAAKGGGADFGRIKRALDTIKTVGDAIGTGKRIADLCEAAYKVIAPLVGQLP